MFSPLPGRFSLQIGADIRAAKRELKKAQTVLQMDQLKCRKRVLRRLGFASPSDVIEMKGRVACEISRSDGVSPPPSQGLPRRSLTSAVCVSASPAATSCC